MSAINPVTVGLSLLFAISVSAHHSFPETYNTSQVAEIEGEVTEVDWVNPHVRFVVETTTGERWQIESNSVNGMARRQLTAELIDGARIRVAGFPARNGDPELYTSHLLLADGREILLRPGVELRWTDP